MAGRWAQWIGLLIGIQRSAIFKNMKITLVIFIYLAGLSSAFASPDTQNFPYQVAKPRSRQQTFTKQLPQRALETLKKHPRWQTAAGIAVPGLTPLITANRRWVLNDSKGSIELQEETQLSAVLDCTTKKYIRWESARIEVASSFYANEFLIGNSTLCNQPKNNQKFSIQYMTGDRFALLPSEPGVAVIFFPVSGGASSRSQGVVEEVHVFSSPLGLSEFIPLEDGVNAPKNNYLHHDLTTHMTVVLDQSFPDQFIGTLQESLSLWNLALGKDFFRLQKSKEIVDPYDCLSSKKLCFIWSGPTQVSFLGVTGMTGFVFDPSLGTILGGYIGLQGTKASSGFEAPQTPELDHFINESMTVDDVAKLFLQREELAKVFHPKPLWALGYTISHEIGHFNGLKHNFYGSHNQNGSNETDSVMDYQVFSALTSKSSRIEKLDLDAIALANSSINLPAEYRYCRDQDASMAGVAADPNCNVFDIGRSDNWFISLARFAPQGVFSSHPRFNGLLLDYLGAFLEKGKPTVTPAQVANVKEFLCESYPNDKAVVDHLKKNNDVDLVCK